MLANEFTPDQFYAHLDWPVQWGDQDLFGHVNNTVYFRWFESARIKFLELLGLAKLHDPKEEHGPILVHAGCNFRRQLEYPDTIKIGSRVARVGTTSFTLEHALVEPRSGNGTSGRRHFGNRDIQLPHAATDPRARRTPPRD